MDGDTLKLQPIPRAKYPLGVTVVAWQWGRAAEPTVKTAPALEQTFNIVR